MKKLVLVAAIVAAIALAGCTVFEATPPAEEAPATTTEPQENATTTPVSPLSEAPKEINMVSSDLAFVPSSLSLKLNEPVKLVFNNSGTHTFTVDELGINVPLIGTSSSVEFTPVQAGAFEFYCSTPGHKEGGMKGTLTVTE